MSDIARGATPDDWFHFDFVLGLGGHLLPCVPEAPDVKVVKGSAIEGKVGKIPSMFNRAGEAHGLTEWQKRPILGNEVQIWSKDPRLNVCVRLGSISGVYALDVDVDDIITSEAVGLLLWWNVSGREQREPITTRIRPNSGKFLFLFRIEGSPCLKKRKIKLDDKPRGPAIEFLADGQQCVVSGSHSSGVRYQWLPGLPTDLPVISLDQLNQMWQRLTSHFAMGPASQLTTMTTASAGSLTQSTVTNSISPSSESLLTEISEPDWLDLRAALRFMLDKVADNDTWSQIGYALLSLQKTRPAEQLFKDFSRKAVGYVAGDDDKWWEAHKGQTPRSDWRHIFTMARTRGFGSTSSVEVFPPTSPPAAEDIAGPVEPDGTPAAEGLDVAPPPLPARPFIRLSDPQLNTNIKQLEQLLATTAYTQGNILVRPTRERAVLKQDIPDKQGNTGRVVNADGVERAPDQFTLVSVTRGWTRTQAMELCDFQRFDGRAGGWVGCSCSNELVLTWMDQGDWPLIRPLDAIATAPFVRMDGSICDQSGYDPWSRALLVPSADFPRIPVDPRHCDAEAALGRIRRVFDQFPWKEPASESAFLSHVLSEASRLAVDRCPMFWYTAPSAGTGKGLLAEMASTIVHGSAPALRPWVSEGDELRKTLFSSLLAGDRSIAFDNVPTGFKARAPALCAFITAAVWQDRKLGVSETLAVPNKAIVSASGNNITPVSDMARRSIVVRLDANTDKLKERRFRIADLRSHVLANRTQLLVDALTIIKAYGAVHGAQMPVPLPSFERWSRVAREPLIWLGLPDPCDTQNETDDETSNLGGVFAHLAMHFGDREFTGYDIARQANSVMDSEGELMNALQQNGCNEPNNPLKIGYWLRGERDKVSAGWKLVSLGHSMRGAKWRLTRINEDLT